MDLTKNIEDFDLVFLDLETTGLDVLKGEAICEIGALKVCRRQIIDKFHSLINPKKSIPAEAFKIHQISDEEVKQAPYFEDIAGSLLNFLNHSVILAYNIEFDLGFLNHELKKLGRKMLEAPAIDILCMARKTVRLPKYNLAAIASFLNLEYCGKMHRALDDAGIASGVFFKLRDILKECKLNNLEDYISIYGLANGIFRLKEEPKVQMVKKAISSQMILKTRYFSYQNTMEEEHIKPLNLSYEERNFFLCYQNKLGRNTRINLNRILELKIV
jgi:DNA polymerase III epsilon subunit